MIGFAVDLTRYRVGGAPRVRADARTIRPNYAIVEDAKLMRYRTDADYPDYSRYFDGNGIEVPEGGSIPRSDAIIGIETGWIGGGGCVPVVPTEPASGCLQEPDPTTGTPHTVWKERERWIFRMSYIDPTDPQRSGDPCRVPQPVQPDPQR